MYENMVKEAYDQIMGFDKEAAFERVKAWGAQKKHEGAQNRQFKTDTKTGKHALKNDQASKINEMRNNIVKQYLSDDATNTANLAALYNLGNEQALARRQAKRDMKSERDAKKSELKRQRNTDFANLYAKSVANTNEEIGQMTDRYKALKDVSTARRGRASELAAYDTSRAGEWAGVRDARLAAKQAEKAAAYYDEAQLVKEAAEYDYAEACAYEEAALSILDELGYLD